MSFPVGYDMYMHGTSEAISFSQFPNLQNLIPNQFPAWRGKNKIPNLFPISQPRGNPVHITGQSGLVKFASLTITSMEVHIWHSISSQIRTADTSNRKK